MPKPSQKQIAKAKRAVRRKFPEMTGVDPTVSTRGQSKGTPAGRTRYVLTFKKKVPLPDGKSLARTVRVTMDEEGEIVKLTSSK